MRRFTENEKNIIRRLIANDAMSNNYIPLISVFGDIFYQHRVRYYLDYPGKLYFYRKLDSLDTGELISISNHLLTISVLVDYLSEQGLAIIIPFPSSTNNGDRYYGKFEIAEDERPVECDLPSIIENKLRKGFDDQLFVAETLRNLVENDFKFPEDLILENALELAGKSKEQISIATEQKDIATQILKAAQEQSAEAKEQTAQALLQTSEAKEQTRLAQEQTNEAKEQTRLAQEQSAEAKTQTAEAKVQTSLAQEQTAEAHKQTSLAQEQSAEAKVQSTEAKEQTRLAQKQTDEAKKQTVMSAIVLGISIITLIFTLMTTKCSGPEKAETTQDTNSPHPDCVVSSSTSNPQDSIEKTIEDGIPKNNEMKSGEDSASVAVPRSTKTSPNIVENGQKVPENKIK